MSPSQLWANYDADAVRLKSNFLKYDTDENGVVDFEVYLSCEETDGNAPILAYCYGKIPKQNSKNATLIYITGYKTDKSTEIIDTYLPKGYGVVFFDYMGDSPKPKHTVYPPHLDYANYIRSGKHLDGFEKSPKDSCVFIWSKICRNVITFVKKLLGDDNKIYMRSSLEGGNILWQVAGIDRRIDGIIAADNAGWAECRGLFRFDASAEEYNFPDEKLKWMSACSPQSYAKFVTCPILFISGTNSTLTSIDRVEKTLSLTSGHPATRACLCANLANTMNASAMTSMSIWLDNVLENKPISNAPTVNFDIKDGKLVVSMDYDRSLEINRLMIYHCYDEINSELRQWNRNAVTSDNSSVEVPVRDGDKRIFAFASVYYADGQFYSSLPVMIDLKDKDLTRTPFKRSHIIYERKHGINAWVVDNNKGEYFLPEFKTGAFEITGVTAQKGNLSTYSISDKIFENNENSLFQFDCYCEQSRSLTVEMCVETSLFKYEYYRAEVKLNGGEWQKIALSHNDFKTKDLVPLKDWAKVKKLSYLNINDTLIGHIIWV